MKKYPLGDLRVNLRRSGDFPGCTRFPWNDTDDTLVDKPTVDGGGV